MKSKKSSPLQKPGAVTLKTVANYLGLTAGTVSVVLNNSKSASSIPEHTRARILEAARKLKYQPNFVARSLRVKRTFTIGVITEEFGDAYGGGVLSGVETYLRENNYFLLAVAHRHDLKLQQSYAELLTSRGVEGLITIDTSVDESPLVPTIAVAGHKKVENVTNITLDHRSAAQLALQHLKDLDTGASRFCAARQRARTQPFAGNLSGKLQPNWGLRSSRSWFYRLKGLIQHLTSDIPMDEPSLRKTSPLQHWWRTTIFLR